VHENFHSKLLDNTRRIWVWLPPSYRKDTDARYPVLYMHDGQNVFDDATSFAGEWRSDETAATLIESKRIVPIIIVAIENNAQRMDEYTHTRSGGRYARFLLDELKPFIDKTYRTRSGREHTALAGSSLGGLISLYIASKYPDRVGMAGVISPALWWDERRLLADVAKDTAWTRRARIWLDVGTKEGADAERYLRHTRELAGLLRTAGMQEGQDFVYREIADAPHNEAAWAARFDRVLDFFFREPQ
jgi:predicted alpha/beta superfamily hydrolase